MEYALLYNHQTIWCSILLRTWYNYIRSYGMVLGANSHVPELDATCSGFHGNFDIKSRFLQKLIDQCSQKSVCFEEFAA